MIIQACISAGNGCICMEGVYFEFDGGQWVQSYVLTRWHHQSLKLWMISCRHAQGALFLLDDVEMHGAFLLPDLCCVN
jgi:hypothetical protein